MFQVKKKNINEKKALEGVWIEYADGFESRIAKAGNKNIQKGFRQLRRKYRNWDRLSAEKQEELTLGLYIKYLILEWRGIFGEDKKPLELTVENLKLVCEQEEGYLEWALAEAKDDAHYSDDERDPEDTVEGLEAIAGN